MKTFILLLSSLLFITNCTFAEKKWPKIYDTSSGNWINLEQVEEIMQKQRVVFVGEKHGHRWGHRIERMLLEAFWNVRGDVTVALEMFERDTQNIIDGYLRDEVSEDFFLRNTRPWKNYKTDYRPLVEFAKDMRLSVLAMNVPRRYASFVAKNKEEILFAMPNKEQTFMAQRITAPKDRYLEKFRQAMQGMPEEMISSYYRAQCFKDDTMAKSMAVFLHVNPRASIIAYMGSFHSDERLGTVQRFTAMSRVKPLVITIVPVSSDKIENAEKYKSVADLVFFAPANPSSRSKMPRVHPNPHAKGKTPAHPNPHNKEKTPVHPNPHSKEKTPVHPNPHSKEKAPVHPNPHNKGKTPAHPNPHKSSQLDNTKTEVAHGKTKQEIKQKEDKAKETEASETKTEASETKTEASETKTEASENKTEASETKTEASENKTEASENKTEASETKTEASETKTEASENKTEVKQSEEVQKTTSQDDK